MKLAQTGLRNRFANILGYRFIRLVEAGRENDAESALRLIADAGGFNDRPELLKALAEGFERHGQKSLAAVAYTLAWTRARGRGWLDDVWRWKPKSNRFDALRNLTARSH